MAEVRQVRGFATAVLLGLVLGLSGCAYTTSEFAQSSPIEAPAKPIVLTDAVPQPIEAPTTAAASATLTVPPTALVEEEMPPLPRIAPVAAADETASVAPVTKTPDGYPNINAVPPKAKGKLLTPEEKAKVIADLEALAKAQGAETEKVRKAQAAECAAEAANRKPPVKGDNPATKC